MDRVLLFIVLGLFLSGVVTSKGTCRIFADRLKASKIVRCTELTQLGILSRVNNAIAIEITDSKIEELPGYAFVRFASTLKKLDLHGIGMKTINDTTFRGLPLLEELVLWGNQLEMVIADYFTDTPNLKTLDVSFNNILVIDYNVFAKLPNLENLYFDNNRIEIFDNSVLATLKNLKNVKFDRNPLKWGYRVVLMWQLDNQKVKYREEWENWEWMKTLIKECVESGRGQIPRDTVLDCVVGELLDFAHEIFSTETRQQKNECIDKAERAVRSMRPKNVTGSNTDNETIRRILESYATAILIPTTKSLGRFSSRCQLVVTICRLEGPRLRMQIPYSETIGFVKQRLAELLQEKHRNWKPDRMKLWIRGFYLEDNRTLSDYNLTSEDRIMLLLDDRCSL